MGGMTTPLQPESNVTLLVQSFALVSSVRAELQALVPQAQISGSAGVTGAQLQRWQAALQGAIDLLGRIVVILIFPPPPIAKFTNQAREQIQAAQQILQAVPTTLIFPPELARGSISLQMLQAAIMALTQAEAHLIQALRVA